MYFLLDMYNMYVCNLYFSFARIFSPNTVNFFDKKKIMIINYDINFYLALSIVNIIIYRALKMMSLRH